MRAEFRIVRTVERVYYVGVEFAEGELEAAQAEALRTIKYGAQLVSETVLDTEITATVRTE